ncbi:MAG: hypothetical protein ABSE73_29025 [Planctomycetota bacterium]
MRAECLTLIIMAKRRGSAGRPPLGKNARRIIIFARITANEASAWRKAAKKAKMSFGSWLLLPRRQEGQK